MSGALSPDRKPAARRRPFELNLVIGGVGLRIRPSFWLVAAAFGLRLPYLEWAVWVVIVLMVVLVHETVHALALRRSGFGCEVVLSGMGGRTVVRDAAGLGIRRAVGIALLGPLVSLGLAGACYLLLPMVVSTSSGFFGAAYYHFVRAGAAWGAVNLLPIGPFDGGYVLRLLLVTIRGETAGQAWSALISVAVSIVMTVVSWQAGVPVASAFFAYCALLEWQQTLD